MPVLRATTDGLVIIRPPGVGDSEMLIIGRDEAFHRWLGPGTAEPQPIGCIAVHDEIVGWVDYDADREWLRPGEVNVGYNVFAPHRGNGFASRSVQLLMHHLAVRTDHTTATLLIDAGNERSLALAARTGFSPSGEVNGDRYFKRPVPPLSYTDGVVTIRRQRAEDLDDGPGGQGRRADRLALATRATRILGGDDTGRTARPRRSRVAGEPVRVRDRSQVDVFSGRP